MRTGFRSTTECESHGGPPNVHDRSAAGRMRCRCRSPMRQKPRLTTTQIFPAICGTEGRSHARSARTSNRTRLRGARGARLRTGLLGARFPSYDSRHRDRPRRYAVQTILSLHGADTGRCSASSSPREPVAPSPEARNRGRALRVDAVIARHQRGRHPHNRYEPFIESLAENDELNDFCRDRRPASSTSS